MLKRDPPAQKKPSAWHSRQQQEIKQDTHTYFLSTSQNLHVESDYIAPAISPDIAVLGKPCSEKQVAGFLQQNMHI